MRQDIAWTYKRTVSWWEHQYFGMWPMTLQTPSLKCVFFLWKNNKEFPEMKQRAQCCLDWTAGRKDWIILFCLLKKETYIIKRYLMRWCKSCQLQIPIPAEASAIQLWQVDIFAPWNVIYRKFWLCQAVITCHGAA